MELCERETIILLNNQDLKDGFFIFYTTEKKQFNKLVKRIGEKHLIDVKIGSFHYECKVPIKFWSKNIIGIKKCRTK